MTIKMILLTTKTPRKDPEEDLEKKRIVEGHQMMKKQQQVVMKSWKERKATIEVVFCIMMRLLIDLKDR